MHFITLHGILCVQEKTCMYTAFMTTSCTQVICYLLFVKLWVALDTIARSRVGQR